MPNCSTCGNPAIEGDIFCRKCGERLTLSFASSERAPSAPLTPNEEYTAFIGDHADKYIMQFNKFNINGTDKFVFTWHWPVFFVPVYWMIYRKLYLWALFAFLISCGLTLFPCVGLPIRLFLFGILGNYIYYKHAQKRISEIQRRQISPALQKSEYARSGGINVAGVVIIIVLHVFIVGGILTAIAIPQFYAYRNKAFNSAAHAALKNAIVAQETYFADNLKYTDSIEELSGPKGGFNVGKGVIFKIVYADKDGYVMEAFHEKGNKKYVINGPEENIKEIPKEK